MILTVFYIASTWIQTWRVNVVKKKILQYALDQSSYVFYRLPEEYEEINAFKLIPSAFAVNKDDGKLSELLWDELDYKGCLITPKQVIDVTNWISYAEEVDSFPLRLTRSQPNLSEDRLLILLEAIWSEGPLTSIAFYDICQVGILKAWRAEETFGLIMESDLDHLATLTSNCMAAPICLDERLTLYKIETVDVTGRPCLVVNTNKIPVSKRPVRSVSIDSPLDDEPEFPRRYSMYLSPTALVNHLELLRSFSKCAEEATDVKPIVVPDHRSACLVRGARAIHVSSPTIINIPEAFEETTVDISKESSLTDSGPGTPELKDILRGLSPRSVCSETAPIARSEVSSGDSTPIRASSARGDSLTLVTPTARSAVTSCASTPARILPPARKNTFSSISSFGSLASISTVSLRSGNSIKVKPPNVLVYSESVNTTDNVKAILNDSLHRHKYTIYSISKEQLASSAWAVNCSLLVVCGNLPDHVESILVNYILSGGRLFCLCSAFLHSLLPTFRTAEVRERELVRFTYAKWNRVRLMHHVFCYQNSPARTKFSREADEPPSEKDRVSPVPVTPATVLVADSEGRNHTLHVQVLGKEETWQTPSLLLAYFPSPGGRVVFSQVHLELDPSEILEEREGEALRSSDSARKEIIRDILSTHLGLECDSGGGDTKGKYTVAYFLGRHELKLAFLDKIRGCERLGSMPVRFCGKNEDPPAPSATLLPILIHSCPRDFSTLEYFETLTTESLGRLLIYSEVMGSSMTLIEGEVAHGLTVVASHQTAGKGRSGNQWLSPPGCVMFSQQIHFPLESYLGRHPSIVQHAVAVAVVVGLSEISPQMTQALDLRLKWPNDIYTGDLVKVGGVLATCSIMGSTVHCNIGCGVNLDNDSPTTCLNSQIKEFNKTFNQNIPKLSREKLLALTFSKLEEILDRLQEGDVSYLHDLYYSFWLHGDAQVSVIDSAGDPQPVVVCGIDEYGYLRVREQTGQVFSVQPDGNAFDMMEGLIMPKHF